jgi:outer membrane protein assembly factor BamB
MRRGTVLIVAALGATNMIIAACAARQETPPSPAATAVATPAWRKDVTVAGQPLIAASGRAIFVSSAESGLTAYSADDGRELWTSQLTSDFAPVFAGSLVGTVRGATIRFVDQESGRAAWQAELSTDNPVSSVRSVGGLVLVGAGPELRAWRPDGSAAWQQTLPSAPVTRIVGGAKLLIVGLPTPELVALEPATGSVAKRIGLPSAPSSLAAGGDDVFVSLKDEFHAYDVTESFDRSWQRRMIDPVGDPFVDEKNVYVVLVDHTLQAYDRSGGSQRWSFPFAWRPVGDPAFGKEHVLIALATGEVAHASLSNGRPSGTGEGADPGRTRLNAATAAPDGSTLFTIATSENQTRTLTAWRPGKR